MAEHGEHGPTPEPAKAHSTGSHKSEGGIIGGAGELASDLLGGFTEGAVIEPGPITGWLGAEGGGKGKAAKSSH